jgi:plasmid stabilization system protein ParE
MALKIYWTPNGLQSYSDILDFIADQQGLRALDIFDDHLQEALVKISNFPEMFRPIGDQRLRKGRVTKYLSIYYRISDDRIEILTLWDDRRGQDPLLLD